MKPLDIDALLRRGGLMSAAEEEQLSRELTRGKLLEMSTAIAEHTMDQPVKVTPFTDNLQELASGYFTQQKFIWGATPEQMELVLGMIGKLQSGACVLQFSVPLTATDYESRAYSYLPDGREYKADPKDTMYVPGKGASQWRLKHSVPAKCFARLRPGQAFNGSSLIR